MDKMKGLAKGGWHPSGDKQIHRDTWKTDLKGIATGKKKDPYEQQRNHQSAPLTTLRDPESFAPPPKHKDSYNDNGIARTGTGLSAAGSVGESSAVGSGPTGGLGAPAVESGYAQRKREQEEQERQRMEQQQAQESTMRGPYRSDTTGLKTDNLPKPPVRRGAPTADSPVRARASPTLPPRQQMSRPPPPAAPPRQVAAAGPPPLLPPRQNEYPDEHTPAPPPPYREALQTKDPAQINQVVAARLGQAGVSIPGFGIGTGNGPSTVPESPARGPQAPQLSELQQRFARMNIGAGNQPAPPISPNQLVGVGMAAAAATQKKPPPPPPKRATMGAPQQDPGWGSSSSESQLQGNASAPPPVPMSSKPRPG